MGLDMYLTKKTDVKNWSFKQPEELHAVSIKKGGKKHTHIKPKRVSNITEEVGYWRKANHIHQWFVQNVQGGKDECEEHQVTEEKMLQLKDACEKTFEYLKTVKNGTGDNATYDVDEKEMSELLPTSSGFFFGGTQYDGWYLQDTKDTIKIIDDALKGCSGDGNTIGWDIEFYYRSSW